MGDDADERIHKAFRSFDLDGDGIVQPEELGSLLQALDPGIWTDEAVEAFLMAADANDDGQIAYKEFIDWVQVEVDPSDILEAGVALSESCPPGMKPCRYGAACYNRKPDHVRRFWHPLREEMKPNQRRACMYGSGCYRRAVEHLDGFAHPGDRNYRCGLVYFGGRVKGPEFATLWQVFTYYDPDESGQWSYDEFSVGVQQLMKNRMIGDVDVDAAWEEAGGQDDGYINFSRFADWASNMGLDLPNGLEEAGASRPCNFAMGAKGWRCGCACYEPGPDGYMCICGHKPSMHRSQQALKSNAEISEENRASNWIEGETGLVEEEDSNVFAMLQEMMDAGTKKENNWTRDRGCKIHGRGHPDCSWSCIRANGHRVPTGYQLVKVLRNQNPQMWRKFCMMKMAVQQECTGQEDFAYEDIPVNYHADLDAPLAADCNEWRLFHGSSWGACQGICDTNFRLSLSGTGATWKEPGADKGSPLYGFGIYLAEMLTKSDEYAGTLPDDHPDAGLNCALVCRCVGGRSQLVTTNEIDKVKLRTDVYDGPYHSVFGDRVVTLGKPYREIVVYDKDQIYPEFVILYERLYD